MVDSEDGKSDTSDESDSESPNKKKVINKTKGKRKLRKI